MDSQRLLNDTIKTLALVLHYDEGVKLHHAWRVAVLAQAVGAEMGLPEKEPLFLAGLLHDIGAIGLEDHVVHHGMCSADSDARDHATKSVRILRPLTALKPILPLVAQHHEHVDGSAFPEGATGEKIPHGASILHVADALELAMRSAPADDRLGAALALAAQMRAIHAPPSVVDATVAVLRRGALVRDLFDEPRLGELVNQAQPALQDVERVDRIELLGQLFWVFARLVDAKHPLTMGHSTRVAFYAYIIFTDPNGIIIDVNRKFIDIYGYQLKEVVGKSTSILKSGKQTAAFYREMWACIKDERIGTWHGEVIDRRKNGEEVEVLLTINSVRDSSGTCIGYIAHSLDVTEKKRLERRLAEMAEFADQTPAPVLRLDGEMRVLLVNREARELFGASHLVGASWPRLCPELDIETCKKHLESAGSYQHEARIKDRYFLITYRPAEGRELINVYSADITERKRVEEELIERDRELRLKNEELGRLNRLKSDLMAITSHDLKSPLATILGLASSFKERFGAMSREAIADDLGRILGSGHRLVNFINDILDIEKIESGRIELQLRRVYVDELLRLCVDGLAASPPRGLEFTLRVEGTPPPLHADPVRMEQVFSNLLSNAAKFSPDGGQIEATCRVEQGSPEDALVIEISDRGPGIPEQDLAEVFDRFYQVKKKVSLPKRGFGVGLGLAIVKNVVTLHHGVVSASNRSGGGCTFRISLPLRGSPDVGLSAVVLDRGTLREQLHDLLRDEGISAVFVDNLYDAKRVCAYEKPDLLFVDEAAMNKDAFGLVRWAGTVSSKPIQTVICTGGEIDFEPGLFDHVLISPPLDVEVLEIVKTVELAQRKRRSWRAVNQA